MDLTHGPEYDDFREELKQFLAEHWPPKDEGTREAAVIYFFGVVGVNDPAQSVAFALMYVLLGLYAVALLGLFAWLFMPRSLREKIRAPVASPERDTR